MPYPAPSGSIIEGVVRYTVSGQTCLNVFHWRLDYTGTARDGPTLMNALEDQLDVATTGWSNQLGDVLSNENTINELSLQLIHAQRYARRSYTPLITAGKDTDASAPSNIDCVATKRSEAAGRHGHGSTHVSGFAIGQLFSTEISAAVTDKVAEYVAKMTTLVELTDGVQFRPIIYRRLDPNLSAEITSRSVSNIPRTMRRRGLRLGI